MDWKDLTEEEKRAIHNSEDYPIISAIDGLSDEDRGKIYRSVMIKEEYFKEFMCEQKKWIEDLAYFMGQRMKKDPQNSPELLSEINGPFHERFRLYYAAKYPDRAEIGINRKTLDFFVEIDNLLKLEKLLFRK